jgi:phage shock protein C
MMENKLYRSRSDAMIAGVCGGLGQYLGVDSTWVRLFFIMMLFFHGVGFWVYLVLAIIVPRVPQGEEVTRPVQPWNENPDAIKVIGGALVLFGLVALVSNLNLYWLSWLTFNNLWPAALILIGVLMLWRVFRGGE